MKETHNPRYDYNPETDEPSRGIQWLIIIAAIILGVYLAYVMV